MLMARLDLTPEDTNTRLLLAACLAGRGDTGPAEQTLRAGVAIDPADVSIRLQLATLLSDADRVEDALHEYRAVLAQDPDHREATQMVITLNRRLASPPTAPVSGHDEEESHR